MGTWSGSFTNEIVAATPYQAKNGVRGAIDMTTLGDVEVIAPPNPEDQSSFSIWFKNENRNTLTITAPAIQDPVRGGVASQDFVTRMKHAVLGFTFINSQWYIDTFTSFDAALGIDFAVQWEPRGSNGECIMIDTFRVAQVLRTAEGRYQITVNAETTITSQQLLAPQPYAINVPADNTPEINVLTIVGQTIECETGIRNKTGQWVDSDLDQHVTNKLMIMALAIP
jgi:hypothetical protein